MTLIQAVVMAALQGVTELFPISSLGHAVIAPALLGWRNVDENAAGFLPFLAVMHLGTAIALLGYFWRDWWDFAVSILRFKDPAGAADRRLFWRVVGATIPAVVIGFLFEKALRHGFAQPRLAALFLMLNGFLLLVADRARRAAARPLAALTWLDSLVIGLCQCLALIPGLSRSGATMGGGYLRGLDHEAAARFSFLTATPIILGAVALEAPKLLHNHENLGTLSLIAGVVSGLTALISVWAVMRWFKAHEARGFTPFAIYCLLAGAGSLLILSRV
jgi:undecaprenyl-diphosphatase